MREIVLATHNAGKVREFAAVLEPLGLRLWTQTELGIAEAPEAGLTFLENALAKARHASALSGLPALADDSGLCVEHLQGAPGLHSARYAGAEAGARDNIERLLEELKGVPETARGAHFHCTLVLLRHPRDPAPLLAEGRWRGRILSAPQGEGGFGYDPVFHVPGQDCSAAELPPAVKNAVSHRAQALNSLLTQLESLAL